MTEADLPTRAEVKSRALEHLHRARVAMADARDELNSDWRPLGAPLSDTDATARSEALRIVGEVKALIDEAKGVLGG